VSTDPGVERELFWMRWGLAGVAGVGAFVIYITLGQLEDFKSALEGVGRENRDGIAQISSSTQTALMSVTATMNAVAAKLERVDERVDTLRESRRELYEHAHLPPSQAHAREQR
jgi:hypothetical protein